VISSVQLKLGGSVASATLAVLVSLIRESKSRNLAFCLLIHSVRTCRTMRSILVLQLACRRRRRLLFLRRCSLLLLHRLCGRKGRRRRRFLQDGENRAHLSRPLAGHWVLRSSHLSLIISDNLCLKSARSSSTSPDRRYRAPADIIGPHHGRTYEKKKKKNLSASVRSSVHHRCYRFRCT
jgi:hypothetical protein